jgi:hypothetical protein
VARTDTVLDYTYECDGIVSEILQVTLSTPEQPIYIEVAPNIEDAIYFEFGQGPLYWGLLPNRQFPCDTTFLGYPVACLDSFFVGQNRYEDVFQILAPTIVPGTQSVSALYYSTQKGILRVEYADGHFFYLLE